MKISGVRVARNVSSYTVAGMLPYLVSFITLPIYTRFLEPDDYGILALVASFTALLVPFVTLQLGASIGRHYFDYQGEELKQFFSTTFYSVGVTSLTGVLLTVALGNRITSFVFPKANILFFPYFSLGLATMFFSELAMVIHLFVAAKEQGHLILLRSLASTAVGLALGLWFVVGMKMGAAGPLLAGACAALLSVLLSAYIVREYFVWCWRRDFFWQSFHYSWPIIPHAFGGYLFMYSDQLIMEKFLPLASIGLYGIADRFSRILKLLVNSINTALHPNFMHQAKENREKAPAVFRKIIEKWAVAVSASYLVLALFSEEALIVLTPSRYHAAYAVIPILLAAYIFRGLYCFASYPLFYEKKTKLIPLITGAAGCANVILNILLIPTFGIVGAAWTTVLSFALTFAMAHYFSRSVIPMEIPWATLGKVFSLTAICTVAGMAGGSGGFAQGVAIKLAICAVYGCIMLLADPGDVRGDLRNIRGVLGRRKAVLAQGGKESGGKEGNYGG